MRSDWDVLCLLLDRQSGPVQAYLNFALYIHDKHHWRLRYCDLNGRFPSENESAKWTEQLTESHFARLDEEAARLFEEAAFKFLEEDFSDQRDRFEQTKRDFEQSAILREVKRAGGWWRQLGISVVTGILSPLILALIIILAAQHLFDPQEIANWLGGHLRR